MSKHQEWKMIHLLYRYGRRSSAGDRRVLTETQLTGAGVHCDADTRQPLEDAGVVTRVGPTAPGSWWCPCSWACRWQVRVGTRTTWPRPGLAPELHSSPPAFTPWAIWL